MGTILKWGRNAAQAEKPFLLSDLRPQPQEPVIVTKVLHLFDPAEREEMVGHLTCIGEVQPCGTYVPTYEQPQRQLGA